MSLLQDSLAFQVGVLLPMSMFRHLHLCDFAYMVFAPLVSKPGYRSWKQDPLHFRTKVGQRQYTLRTSGPQDERAPSQIQADLLLLHSTIVQNKRFREEQPVIANTLLD